MVDYLRYIELGTQALSFLVVAFFFGGGLSMVLWTRIDPNTGLGLEEALYLLLVFFVYACFVTISYLCTGRAYSATPQAIFELTDVRGRESESVQALRPQNPAEGQNGPVRNQESKDVKKEDGVQVRRGRRKKKKKRDKKRDDHKIDIGTNGTTFALERFNLAYVMKAGFRGSAPRGNMAADTRMKRGLKYHVFNLVAVCVPFVFMMVPLVPCWQRDAHGLSCSASGSPAAVFIIVWNCLVSFLLGLHYAGMLLTAGTLLGHCEGMARVMCELVSTIESIDQLEAWHATMWRLHKHMWRKILPFKALILTSMLFGLSFTIAAVGMGIGHFSVNDSEEVKELECAWIQLLMCSVIFAIPSIFVFAFAAQVNSILSKAVDLLDQTGVCQDISLAEYYTTVIEYWKKKKKGFTFCGVHITDLTCFYFTVSLAVVSLTPIVYAGSF